MRSGLPAPVTGFVGRAGDVVSVGRVVAQHRLVTLTGPGGVGKTRLAVEVARTAQVVAHVALAHATGDVAGEALTQLGIVERRGELQLTSLVDELRAHGD